MTNDGWKHLEQYLKFQQISLQVSVKQHIWHEDSTDMSILFNKICLSEGLLAKYTDFKLWEVSEKFSR